MATADQGSSTKTAMSNIEPSMSVPSTSELGNSGPSMEPSTSIPASKPLPKGPIKRKPRQTLEQLSAGLTAGKKMTTLEKVSQPLLLLTTLLVPHLGTFFRLSLSLFGINTDTDSLKWTGNHTSLLHLMSLMNSRRIDVQGDF